MKFDELIDADRRLLTLQCLNEDPGYSLNEAVLQSMLEALGHSVSRDRLRTDLAWLAEQGLVSIGAVGTVQVAMITGRGVDVAVGRVIVPGVRRPRPE